MAKASVQTTLNRSKPTLGILVVVVPLSFLVRRSPESMGLLPDGDQPRCCQGPSHPALHVRMGATADGTAAARLR